MSASNVTTDTTFGTTETPRPEGIDGIEISRASLGLTLAALAGAGAVMVGLLFFWIAEHPRWVAYEQLCVLALAGGLTYLGIIDALTRRISNFSTAVAALIAVGILGFAWISGFQQQAVIGAAVGVLIGVILVLAYVFSPVRRMGGGDVKLIPSVVAVLGCLSPLSPSIWLLFMLLFALMGVAVLAQIGRRPVITLAPMMALSLIPTFWYISEMSWAILV